MAGVAACARQQDSAEKQREQWADEQYAQSLEDVKADFVIKARPPSAGGDWTLERSKARRVGNGSILVRFAAAKRYIANTINPAWLRLFPSGKKLPSGTQKRKMH